MADTQQPSAVIRRALRFSGSVQGVGFRYRAVYAANAVGATGWVRNDADGGVSMEIQGTEQQIDQVILAIARGTYVQIDHLSAKTIPVVEGAYGFHVRDEE